MPNPEPEIITIETWKDWVATEHQAQLIDVRSPTEFAAGHLPGAANIPLEQIERRTADLAAHAPVVLVCQAGTRACSAQALLAGEAANLLVLEGGTDAWIKAGYPVVRNTPARWALERQVRLIAGGLVAAGTGLGVALSPWFLILPAFVGCGLFFAGISGFCPMGEVLAHLPWNRARRSAGTASMPAEGISCACELAKRP